MDVRGDLNAWKKKKTMKLKLISSCLAPKQQMEVHSCSWILSSLSLKIGLCDFWICFVKESIFRFLNMLSPPHYLIINMFVKPGRSCTRQFVTAVKRHPPYTHARARASIDPHPTPTNTHPSSFMNWVGGCACAPVTSKGKGNRCKSHSVRFVHPFDKTRKK